MDKCRRCKCVFCVSVFFFFKQKTAYEMRISDWSSDVCSSDLCLLGSGAAQRRDAGQREGADRGERGHHRQGAAELQAVEGIAASVLAEIGRASCRERVCQYV